MTIIRFRSRDGQFRLNCEANTPFSELLNELVLTKLPPIDTSSLVVKFPGPGLKTGPQYNAHEIADNTVEQLGLKNGDMLMLEYSKSEQPAGVSISGTVAINASSTGLSKPKEPTNRTQSKLDDDLDKDSGLIPRKRGNLCRHNDKGMCEYCSPLPPWDREYQADNNIKHISFHAYVDELNSSTNKEGGSSYIAPLQESDFAINLRCPSGHEPWPKGICSKCQPSAITLQRQEYRMVDHVEFSNSEMVNNFIHTWRMSGLQRIGLLLGKYERYEKIPLGIKAEVHSIYEFPQIDQDDGLVLQEWEDEDKVVGLCNELGLEPVGIVFTDLSDAGKGDGSVICKRHSGSFFMSSIEVLFAVQWQIKYSNKCRWSESGKFSSKFVTCVISGNVNGEIEVNAYQASEAAEGLYKADLICPSTHPDQMFVKETTDKRYVPDIFYTKKNEYGVQVKENAKPSFPVEYLLVSLTHGFPESNDKSLFVESNFPIENRGYLGESQNLSSLYRQLETAFGSNVDYNDYDKVCNELSNWHLLFYLVRETHVLNSEEVSLLLKSVATKDKDIISRLLMSPGWQSLALVSRG